MKQHCAGGQEVHIIIFEKLEVFVKIIVLDGKNDLQALLDKWVI